MWGYFLWLILLCDVDDWHCAAPAADKVWFTAERDWLSWTKVLLPQFKLEVPSLKAPLETFMPFLQGLRIDKVHTSGRRLEPPEKVLHVFPLMVCTVLLTTTNNFWSVFKLKGWEGQSWAGMSSTLHTWLLEESRFCCLLRLNSEALICDQRAPESSQRALFVWCDAVAIFDFRWWHSY